MPGIRRILDESSHWLVRSIDNYLENSPLSDPRGGSFHASSLGNPCNRFLYLHYHGLIPAQKIESQTKRIFDHGNATQERYNRYFSGMGILVVDEVRAFLDDPPIHGRADFLVQNPNGRKTVVEFKTINDKNFKLLPKNGNVMHNAQIHAYLNILENIEEEGIVLYENKDNQKLYPMIVRRNRERWNQTINRCKQIMGLSECPGLPDEHDRFCPCLSAY